MDCPHSKCFTLQTESGIIFAPEPNFTVQKIICYIISNFLMNSIKEILDLMKSLDTKIDSLERRFDDELEDLEHSVESLENRVTDIENDLE